jgi:hypothetical protein
MESYPSTSGRRTIQSVVETEAQRILGIISRTIKRLYRFSCEIAGIAIRETLRMRRDATEE